VIEERKHLRKKFKIHCHFRQLHVKYLTKNKKELKQGQCKA
jgi:hypothetical protein